MIRFLIFCFAVLLNSNILFAQSVEVVKIQKVEALINSKVEGLRIINFWATFCAPCIKEMPQFEEAYEKFSNQGVEIYLISLDFVEDLDKVNRLVAKKGIKNKVLLLNDVDYNSWIDKVDDRWSGAIPVTIVLTSSSKVLIARELREDELNEIIKGYIN